MRVLVLLLLVSTAWGEVLLRGTPIESSHFSGFPASNAFDANLTTFWASNTDGGWVGIDLGSGNTAVPTRFRVAPRQAVPGDSDWNPNILGALLQGSNDCTFAGGVSTLATITNVGTNWLHDHQYNERSATGSTPFRCFRLFGTGLVTGGLQVSELQIIGTVSGGTPSASPDGATANPPGGIFPSGTSIALSSLTTSASLYYTTDGSTPTTAGTLYSAPFTLTPAPGGTTVKVLANDASLSTPGALIATYKFYPGFTMQPDWLDDRSLLIQALSGGITYSGGRYYWFGTPATTVTFTGWEPGINLYSSTSMYGRPWKFEGMILSGVSCTRPHVLRNEANNNFVLWCHNDPLDRAMIATASVITGPWTQITATLDPDGVGFKDCNLFQDLTGAAYVVYANGAQNAFIISRLASDYLSTTGSNISIASGGREGPVMFQRGVGADAVYFLISSSQGFYSNPFTQYYQTASSALGTYTSFTSMGTYQSQSSFLINVQGKQDAYMLGSDHWTAGSGTASAFYAESRQQWMPLVFPTPTSVTMAEAPWDLTIWADQATQSGTLLHGIVGN